MKKITLPLAVFALLAVSCSSDAETETYPQMTTCDCLAESTAGLIEAEKTDYKNLNGTGFGDGCAELYDEISKRDTYEAEMKACPEYSAYNKELNKMINFLFENNLVDDPEYQGIIKELE